MGIIMREIKLQNYELADTLLLRAKGIMFRKRITRPMLFVFPALERVSIHSFFCPVFDAVFLNRAKKVSETYERILPGRMITPKSPAAYLVEFPAGTVKQKGIRKGTVIRFNC